MAVSSGALASSPALFLSHCLCPLHFLGQPCAICIRAQTLSFNPLLTDRFKLPRPAQVTEGSHAGQVQALAGALLAPPHAIHSFILSNTPTESLCSGHLGPMPASKRGSHVPVPLCMVSLLVLKMPSSSLQRMKSYPHSNYKFSMKLALLLPTTNHFPDLCSPPWPLPPTQLTSLGSLCLPSD